MRNRAEMKRSPLKRSRPSYQRTPLRRSQGLRQRSAKTQAVYEIRRPLVARLLEERPLCERCQMARSEDVHELCPRGRGGSVTLESNCVALCRACHAHIHAHPAESERDGWLISRKWHGNA